MTSRAKDPADPPLTVARPTARADPRGRPRIPTDSAFGPTRSGGSDRPDGDRIATATCVTTRAAANRVRLQPSLRPRRSDGRGPAQPCVDALSDRLATRPAPVAVGGSASPLLLNKHGQLTRRETRRRMRPESASSFRNCRFARVPTGADCGSARRRIRGLESRNPLIEPANGDSRARWGCDP